MKDVQWSFISLATASLSHLLLRIILGRELGPDGLGIYTLVFTIYIFGMQFAAFGIGAALTKYVAEFSDDQIKIRKYISSGITGSFIAGSLMGFILFTLSDIISVNVFSISEMEYLLEITAICFPFIALHKTVIGTLNGFRNMKAYAFLNIILNTSILLVSAFMVLYLKMAVFGAVLGFVVPTVILALISIIFVRSYIILPKRSILRNNISRNILHFGLYVVLGNSVAYLYTHIDSLMIGYYLNEIEVGYYSIAAIFVQGITLIPSAIQKITTPAISKYYADKEYKNIIKLMKSSIIKVLFISIAISLFFVFFGKVLITGIFGKVFLPAYFPLVILLVGYTIHSLNLSISTFFSSTGYVKVAFKFSMLAGALNLLLNAILIPFYGIMGAALATTISLIIITLLKFGLIKVFVTRGWKF
jgi:O-antigen/teichoic acid export membrane protein